MKTNYPKRLSQITLKYIPFFIALILFYSCDSPSKKWDNISENSLLINSLDSLTTKVDSLNSRVIQLEDSLKTKESQNNEIIRPITEAKSESKKIICPNCDGKGSNQEKCEHCHGSGWLKGQEGRNGCYVCVTGSPWDQGTGYRNRTCSVCYGSGRINEYE